MSDLSQPPLHDVSAGEQPEPSEAPARRARSFAWPTPPVPGYPAPAAALRPEACHVEGLKGHVLKGKLVGFDPERLRIWLLTPAMGAPLMLFFNQFRRLTLVEPLRPVDVEPLAPVPHRPSGVVYEWTDADGKRQTGRTAPPVEHGYGVFLFEPSETDAGLRRSFIPRAAIGDLHFGSPDEEAATVPMPLEHRPDLPPSTAARGDQQQPPGPEDTAPPYGVGAPDAHHEAGPPAGASAQTRTALCPAPDDAGAAKAAAPPVGAEPLATVEWVPDVPAPVAPAAKAAAAATAAPATTATTATAATPARPTAPAPADSTVSTPAELDQALAAQSRMPMIRIGEALLAMGCVTPAQIEDALSQQRQDHSMPLGEIMVRCGMLKREQLRAALARKMGYPVVDIESFPVDTTALVKVPHAVAARLQVLPLAVRAGRLVVAMDDPSRRPALEELEFVVQASVIPVLARHDYLPGAIDRAYERIGSSAGAARSVADERAWIDGGELALADASELLASLEQHSADQREDSDERQIEQSDNSLVRLINQMILEAQGQGVSDIHIECPPGREKVRIRFRKDGQLRPYLELPHTYRSALIARLKIMCDLDISERRKPQDGKITFGKFHPGARLELRLATIPTHSGLEDAVLRLLASARPLPLDKLGLSPSNLAGLKAIVERPYGLVLCVGPTGSGKTTTLHSALGYINKPDRKIWTAEDPIEITQPGLRQVQVNPKIDWTFAKALRAFLRADPDVVMVGEIRDQETAQTAIEASLTGHLVLSTLHTNSAAETVTRLLDMGMDPFNFADSLLGVLAQRLVRRLCSQCTTARDATPTEIDEWLDDYHHAFTDGEQAPSRDELLADWTARFGTDGRLRHHHAAGCSACDGSGFRGRAALHELLLASRDLRRLIQTGSRAEQVLAQAQREGLRTLRQDGIEKVLAGVTTLEEVRASSNA